MSPTIELWVDIDAFNRDWKDWRRRRFFWWIKSLIGDMLTVRCMLEIQMELPTLWFYLGI